MKETTALPSVEYRDSEDKIWTGPVEQTASGWVSKKTEKHPEVKTLTRKDVNLEGHEPIKKVRIWRHWCFKQKGTFDKGKDAKPNYPPDPKKKNKKKKPTKLTSPVRPAG